MPDRISDEETLFRGLRLDDVATDEKTGEFRVKSSGFYDSSGRPSVDRACLIQDDPKVTKARLPKTVYVCSLTAGQVRSVKSDTNSADVEPAVKGHYEAHAEIFALPDTSKNWKTKTMLTLLARKSRFAIGPEPVSAEGAEKAESV